MPGGGHIIVWFVKNKSLIMMRFSDNYESSQAKRWEVSKDETSRERLKKLKEIYDYFKEQVPGVTVALSLFGSLSKGKELNDQNKDNSDVDVSVFVDYGELMEKFKKILEDRPESEFVKYVKDQAEEYKSLYPKALSFDSDNSKDFIKDALKEFIEDKFKEYFGHLPSGKETAPIIVKPIGLNNESSIAHTANIFYNHKLSGNEEAIELWTLQIARYFHLDVGGGMKKYKEGFYQELAQLLAAGGKQAEYAKSLWGSIVAAMKSIERPADNLTLELEQKFPSGDLEEFLEKQGIVIPKDEKSP